MTVSSEIVQLMVNPYIGVFHIHTDDYDRTELIELLTKIGKPGNVLVARELFDAVVIDYIGPKSGYRKRKLGRKYIFG